MAWLVSAHETSQACSARPSTLIPHIAIFLNVQILPLDAQSQAQPSHGVQICSAKRAVDNTGLHTDGFISPMNLLLC